MFAFNNFFEAFDGIRDLHILSFATGELFRNKERLRKEALDLSRSSNGELIVFG